MTTAELAKKEGGEEAWDAAKGGIKGMGELLKKNGEGPYFMGKTGEFLWILIDSEKERLMRVVLVSYADFVFVGFLTFMKRIDEKVYEKLVEMEPEFGRVYEACGEWLKRDDH